MITNPRGCSGMSLESTELFYQAWGTSSGLLLVGRDSSLELSVHSHPCFASPGASQLSKPLHPHLPHAFTSLHLSLAASSGKKQVEPEGETYTIPFGATRRVTPTSPGNAYHHSRLLSHCCVPTASGYELRNSANLSRHCVQHHLLGGHREKVSALLVTPKIPRPLPLDAPHALLTMRTSVLFSSVYAADG